MQSGNANQINDLSSHTNGTGKQQKNRNEIQR